MENDILDALDDLGYTGDVDEPEALKKIAQEGPASVTYTQIVEWLIQHIADLLQLDEKVHAISSSSDSSNFLLELSGFLREYGCNYPDLTEGPVNDRLNSAHKCLQLLDYLTSELAAVRLISKKKPWTLLLAAAEDTSVSQPESEVARCMKEMFMAVGFPKPPSNITANQLFSKMEGKVKELMAKHPHQVGKPLLKTSLSDEQWEHLLKVNEEMAQDYDVRKQMLLKRLDVTIRSFSNSEKAKRNQDSIAKAYQPIRQTPQAKHEIGIPHILAARDDLTRMQKTSSGDSRKECDVNKVIIGKVPDRGGRAWELDPPPPEMPFFMKRDNSARGHRPYSARGRGGRGGGGDYHQGHGGGYGGGGGDYHQGHGGGYGGGGKHYHGRGGGRGHKGRGGQRW